MNDRTGPGLVLWDIDGTLLTAGDPDHISGLRDSLGEIAGRPVSLDGIVLGGNVERRIAAEALRNVGVPDDKLDAMVTVAIEQMAERYERTVTDRRERLLPGVPGTLEAVSAFAPCGVLTGGARRVARTKLAAAGLDELLRFGAYGDEADDRAELVDHAVADAERAGITWSGRRDHIVVVGDTPADIAAARRAGVAVVAVATGRWSLADLADHAPDQLLADLSDPAAVVHAIATLTGGAPDAARPTTIRTAR